MIIQQDIEVHLNFVCEKFVVLVKKNIRKYVVASVNEKTKIKRENLFSIYTLR